jgi:demethylmenaquinone methyltransferase/2-methoxy-6-polyprenyl-1,4-benzoquinol methylase
MVVLEFSQPRTPVIGQLYKIYMRLIAPRIAGMAASDRDAYRYLNDSVHAFPEGKQLTGILENCGFARTGMRRLTLGVCSVYTGAKPMDGN